MPCTPTASFSLLAFSSSASDLGTPKRETGPDSRMELLPQGDRSVVLVPSNLLRSQVEICHGCSLGEVQCGSTYC